MRKLNLTEWAAVSEIVGTAAVVVSLLFVAYSINHNSAVIQTSNDNFLYELQHARIRDFLTSPGMASIYVKHRRNEELSEVEQERYFWDKVLELSTWEIAFARHRDGQSSSIQWEGWDNYFATEFVNQFPVESWAEVRDFFAEDFKDHVDAAYVEIDRRSD